MENAEGTALDLVGQLASHRGLTDTAVQCLRGLHDRISAPRFDRTIAKRGYFGGVLRWKRGGDLWFDALPARHWVLFYMNKPALRAPGLDYLAIARRLPHTVERRDLVVKVRLHDLSEVNALAGVINAALDG